MSVIRACPECGGTDQQKCAECGGSGHGPKGACGRCDGQGSVSAASQAAKDLAHLLRLLGVDSYEEATVVIAMSGALLRQVAECDDAIPGNGVVTAVRAFLAVGAEPSPAEPRPK